MDAGTIPSAANRKALVIPEILLSGENEVHKQSPNLLYSLFVSRPFTGVPALLGLEVCDEVAKWILDKK